MAAGSSVTEQVSTYTIDPVHSEIGFAARYMGFSKVRGRFTKFKGNVYVDPDQIGTLDAQIEIDAASITTHDETRDEHLRTNDFLAAKEHPQITFKTSGVRDANAHTFTLDGELSIRGVAKRVEVEGTYLGEGKDPWGGIRVGFEGRTTINRKDFGVNWNAALEAGGFLIGDQVEIYLNVQAVLSEKD